jgi:hypothetical protein
MSKLYALNASYSVAKICKGIRAEVAIPSRSCHHV